MTILETFAITAWDKPFTPDVQAQAINKLEQGQVLFLPQLSFQLEPHERRYLSPAFVAKKAKNISFSAQTNELRGCSGSEIDNQCIQALLKRFYQHASTLIHHLFPYYQTALIPARTSFRPVQVSQRKTSYRKDDKRLHVDAFPANPNQGKRILRVFSNINPNQEDRVWRLGEAFETVANHFLPQIPKPLWGTRTLLKKLHITKSQRTEYDHIMLQLHNRMKKDLRYQQNALQHEVRFPPASSWIVQTDKVSHAALSGQHLLEQTFYLPVTAMQNPDYSPLQILERLTGRQLI